MKTLPFEPVETTMNNIQKVKIRKHVLAIVLSALLVAVPAWAQDAPLPLTELLGATGNAFSVLQAEAESSAALQDVARNRAEEGIRFNLGGGYALVRNIVDQHRAFTYSSAQAMAGLSFPLLGTSEQEARNVDAAVGKARESQIRRDTAMRLAALEVESAYARYWGAQESLKLVDAYLASESLVAPKLRLRGEQKLMLESDRLDLETSYDQARSDRLQFERTEDEARSRLQRLSGRQLGVFTAQTAVLPKVPPIDVANLLQRHPDLAMLRARLEALQEQLDDSGWYGFDGSFDIIGTGVQDVSQGGPAGGTAYVGLNFKMPIDVVGARNAQRNSLKAQISALGFQIKDRSAELSGAVASAQQQLLQSEQEGALTARRVQANGAGLREAYLRGGTFADEGIQRVAQRLHAYYRTALDAVNTQFKVWQSNIELRAYAVADNSSPAGPSPNDLGAQLADPMVQIVRLLGGRSSAEPSQPAAVPERTPASTRGRTPLSALTPLPTDHMQLAKSVAPSAPTASTLLTPTVFRPDHSFRSGVDQPEALRFVMALSRDRADTKDAPGTGYAVYVWNSGALINRQHDETLWRGLRAIPIGRLLISLNAAQAADATEHPEPLRAFIAAAAGHGVPVELLLGDPTWITSAQRPKLVALIESLRDFNFAGLDLDIEPDQIYRQPLSRQQYETWIDTLHVAAQASPWPTSVSVHPRYFRDPPYSTWGLAARLRDAGIRRVSLMIYSSDPQRVADTALPIARQGQGLRFRVAQSVEHDLESNLSYANRTPEDFRRSMNRLEALLAAQPNTDGIVVQAWTDLMRMGYESAIR